MKEYTIKEARYFSSDLNRTKVIRQVLDNNGPKVGSTFMGRALMNIVKENEYETLASKDLTEFCFMLMLMSSEDEGQSITQQFLKQCVKGMVSEEGFSCYSYFRECRELEIYQLDQKVVEIAEKNYDEWNKTGNIGLIKKATKELSHMFNNLRLFDVYEIKLYTELALIQKRRLL